MFQRMIAVNVNVNVNVNSNLERRMAVQPAASPRKGPMLIISWFDGPHFGTLDLDLLWLWRSGR
ncbi:hypothetical protein [Rhizobium leguminosarum]|uniref:hypothetical protein n=1 Tax=Rhizobium leguminosarum TaxID=384 RepID=UPI001FDF0C3B|nr:hypothetical protein [Rhizobium leguminosarum]